MDAQVFEQLRASATATEPPRDGADGPAHGSPWTMQVVKAIIKCSGEMQNDLCGKRLDGNFLKWCDTPLIREAGFLHHRWVLVVRRDRGGRPFRGDSRGKQRVLLRTTPRRRPCHGR